jgi:hypothetical protein
MPPLAIEFEEIGVEPIEAGVNIQVLSSLRPWPWNGPPRLLTISPFGEPNVLLLVPGREAEETFLEVASGPPLLRCLDALDGGGHEIPPDVSWS